MSEDNAPAVPEWATTTLPAELHDSPFLKDAPDLATYKQRVNDAASWMGNSLRLPGPDASPEDWTAFNGRLVEKVPGLIPRPNMDTPEGRRAHLATVGMPDNADKYAVPEGTTIQGEQLGQLKSIAFKAGMTQHQFNDWIGETGTLTKAQVDAQILKHEESMAALKGEWGLAFHDRVGQITAMLKADSATPPYILEQLQAGNLPADQVRWLASQAEKIFVPEGGELHSQEGSSTGGMLSPGEATEQLRELMNKMDNTVNPLSAGEKASLNKRREALTYMKTGKRPPAELMRYV